MLELRIDLGDIPDTALRAGPEVGEVYKKDGGPAGFMLIVSDNGSTFGYLAVNLQGKITGVGQGNSYYFSRRTFVGRVEDFPPIAVIWER